MTKEQMEAFVNIKLKKKVVSVAVHPYIFGRDVSARWRMYVVLDDGTLWEKGDDPEWYQVNTDQITNPKEGGENGR